ncbi:MAG TPA: hypothetical protein VKM55_14580 [Candidatus Lokiarchaeia archaeon]|nr:hypothetical protein [Candidatus Lokiarchaeia archaeon]
MNKSINLSTTLLLGSMFGSACVAIFYLGYILRNASSSGFYAIAGFGGLYPIVMMLIANLRERIKKYVLFLNAALAIVGSYFVMLQTPNFMIPDFKLDTLPLYCYFLTVGADFALFEIGVAEVSRRTRDSSLLHIGAGLGLGSVIVAIVVMVGINGWLYMILIVNYIIPIALLVYFLMYPEGKEGETVMFHPQSKDIARMYFVNDTTKGLKLMFYTIITCFGCIATVGVNGMAIPETDIYNAGFTFWIMAAVGSVAAVMIARYFLARIHAMESTVEKERKSQFPWLGFAIFQSLLLLDTTILELYVPGFHLSMISYIRSGFVFGFNIGAYFTVIAVQHPPKSNYAYYMTLSFFVIFSIAAGDYLKIVVSDMNTFGQVAQYAMYIMAALLLMIALLVLAQVITIVRKRNRNIVAPVEVPAQSV